MTRPDLLPDRSDFLNQASILTLSRGHLRCRAAVTTDDIAKAQALRGRCFLKSRGPDQDRFDAISTHVLIDDRGSGDLVGSFRVMEWTGACIGAAYAAQHYDLTALSKQPGKFLEVGRFCIDPSAGDADVLRIALGALARYVDHLGARMLFGCTSFAGVDGGRHHAAFDLLRARYLAPADWAPGPKAAEVHWFGDGARPPRGGAALQQMPTLLRSYLGLGARVSDHAVIDRDLDTMHVFTGLEVERIPPARKRQLRSIWQDHPAKGD